MHKHTIVVPLCQEEFKNFEVEAYVKRIKRPHEVCARSPHSGFWNQVGIFGWKEADENGRLAGDCHSPRMVLLRLNVDQSRD
jgi:hypothetical protein